MSKRGARRFKQDRHEKEGERKLGAMLPVLPREQTQALDVVAEAVERTIGQDESRQPRFTEPNNIFTSTVRWASYAMAHEPRATDSMQAWDKWYREFVCKEPFLAGCLSSAVQIDKNRGWTLTGGRNQVQQYTKRLHGFSADITGIGWRPHIEWLSQSYYTTGIGFIAEVGSQGQDGPLSTLWAVDPCRCVLTGNPDYPLYYYPRYGGQQEWAYGTDFIRGVSQRRTDEDKLGYGYPAVARCYDLAKIMVGVYRHYAMKTGITTPDGILAHNAMSDEQWSKALEIRNQQLISDPDNYLNSIIAVGNPGGEVPQFVMTILSGLPENFDIDQWTLIVVRGYQLEFGYGAGEFYPEQYSVLGRGEEQKLQQRTATSKGGKDFALTHQEQLQSRLPATLEFTYEERDVTGEIEDAQLAAAKAQVITEVNQWTIKSGGNEQSVLTTDQIMQLAAQAGVIPEEWTPQEEEVSATDEDVPDSAPVARAMALFPDEPIVRYSSRTKQTRVLYNPARRVFFMPVSVHRSIDDVANTYRDELTALVENAWRRVSLGLTKPGVMQTALRTEHKRLIKSTGPLAYGEGLAAGGVPAEEADESDQNAIAEWVASQSSYVNDFAKAVVEAAKDASKSAAIRQRVDSWVDAVSTIGNMGKMSAQKNMMVTWRLNAHHQTTEHCKTCPKLDGSRHRMKWFTDKRLIPREPGNPNLECGGWKCGCGLVNDSGELII